MWRRRSTTQNQQTVAKHEMPPGRARGDQIRRFHDEAAKATIQAVDDWTMTSRARVFALIIAVRYVVDYQVPGDIVECGVWRGGSMQAVARTLLERGDTDRTLHLFDTFEGMPPPTKEDRRINGPAASELLATRERTASVWAVAGLEDVQAGMAQTGYPEERIRYHPGLVEDTVPSEAPDRIALLRLDTDWYASTLHELEQLYERLVPRRRPDHRRLRLLGGLAPGHRRVPRRVRRAHAAGAGRFLPRRGQALNAAAPAVRPNRRRVPRSLPSLTRTRARSARRAGRRDGPVRSRRGCPPPRRRR